MEICCSCFHIYFIPTCCCFIFILPKFVVVFIFILPKFVVSYLFYLNLLLFSYLFYPNLLLFHIYFTQICCCFIFILPKFVVVFIYFYKHLLLFHIHFTHEDGEQESRMMFTDDNITAGLECFVLFCFLSLLLSFFIKWTWSSDQCLIRSGQSRTLPFLCIIKWSQNYNTKLTFFFHLIIFGALQTWMFLSLFPVFISFYFIHDLNYYSKQWPHNPITNNKQKAKQNVWKYHSWITKCLCSI